MRTSFAIAALLTAPAAAQFTGDPYAAPIPLGALSAQIRDVAVIPDSQFQRPRMNLLAPAYDGSGRLFLVDQRGPMYNIAPDGSSVQLYLDINTVESSLSASFEGGLQGFAFHPDFETNGKFYTLHGSTDTSPPVTLGALMAGSVHLIMLEWTATDPAADTFVGPAPRELFRISQFENQHYGAGLAFDYSLSHQHPDYGLLYISTGDGSNTGDPANLAQSPIVANGKVLRIDPLEGPMGEPYTVPASNPFVGVAGTLDEIYARGFRNPQRISFDPAGIIPDPISADIGQGVVEEVNRVTIGGNFGWRAREGRFEYINGNTVQINPTPANFIEAICEYDHSEGSAITGGYVVRTPTLPGLEEAYVFGDLANGRIFYIEDVANQPNGGGSAPIRELRLTDSNGNPTTLPGELNSSRADLRFGIGEDNRIFILNKRDGVLRVLGIDGPCNAADIAAPFGTLDLIDVQAFLIGFGNTDPIADIVSDGMFDLQDVQTFLIEFGAGCP